MQGEKWKLTSTIKRKCEKGNMVIIQAFQIKKIGMEVIIPNGICHAVSAETSDSVILLAMDFHQVITYTPFCKTTTSQNRWKNKQILL